MPLAADKPTASEKLTDWLHRGVTLEVDLGCGKGLFLASLAEQEPHINFIGIEHQADRVARCNKKIARRALENAEAIYSDCETAVRELFPPESVDAFYVLFPDPWPKRRHHRRRLITSDFLALIRTRLKANGILRLRTDDEPYFRVMERLCTAAPGYKICDWEQGREFPLTDFQKIFLIQGRPIYSVAIQKSEAPEK